MSLFISNFKKLLKELKKNSNQEEMRVIEDRFHKLLDELEEIKELEKKELYREMDEFNEEVMHLLQDHLLEKVNDKHHEAIVRGQLTTMDD